MHPKRIYVGRLAGEVRAPDLKRIFEQYGVVDEIDVKGGYAFVEFTNSEDASAACKGEDGQHRLGSVIQVQIARGSQAKRHMTDEERASAPMFCPPGPRTSFRLRVRGLDDSATWQMLKSAGREFGEVNFASVTGFGNRRQGILEYAREDDMFDALDRLNGKRVGDAYITVTPENLPDTHWKRDAGSSRMDRYDIPGGGYRRDERSRGDDGYGREPPNRRDGWNRDYYDRGRGGGGSYGRGDDYRRMDDYRREDDYRRVQRGRSRSPDMRYGYLDDPRPAHRDGYYRDYSPPRRMNGMPPYDDRRYGR